MSIENNIFKRCKPNFDSLRSYGFKQKKEKYILEKYFFEDQFKVIIEINNIGRVSGTVLDLENDDEFLPLRVEDQQGGFVAEVRNAYETILYDIYEKCFIKDYYIFPQSNRITNLIIKKYGNKPEFLWEQYPGSGIFRNPETNKWYAAILDVEGSKVAAHKKGIIEVIDLKLAPEHVEKITKQPNFYPGYHMNKKFWISIILDDSVSDEKIMELIEESHSYTQKHKK